MREVALLLVLIMLVSVACTSDKTPIDNTQDNIQNNIEESLTEPTEDAGEEVCPHDEPKMFREVEFSSLDGLIITANEYINDQSKDWIILFHMADSSRGEYIETAPRFVALGYNVLAVDLRSGLAMNDVKNETYLRAFEQGLGVGYVDAYVDMESSLSYVIDSYSPSRIFALGSSYSSALVMILATRHGDILDGIMSFSPSNYFTFEGRSISEHSANITVPIFVTSSKREAINLERFERAIDPSLLTSFVPEEAGAHGSVALWGSRAGYLDYWKALEDFLKSN